MTIERRLRNLESVQSIRELSWHRLIVKPHETKEEVVRRHFGEDGPPKNVGIIFRIIVEPPPRPLDDDFAASETGEAGH